MVDALADAWNAPRFRDKFKGLYAKTNVEGEEVVLLKPMTYMNLSGESVQAAMRFFKVPIENVVCVHDELDLAFGTVRLKVGGGTAGHNGLRSIVQHCGAEFVRCRMGIGKPVEREAHAHVLSGFSGDERQQLADVLDQAVSIVQMTVLEGPRDAMNRFH